MGTLRQDDVGDDVGALQERLAELHYNLAAEQPSVFGCRTKASVMRVQYRSNLEPDGIVGPHTANVLKVIVPEPVETYTAVRKVWGDVPYYSQRDNEHNPNGTCNVTSLAMALAFRGVTHVPGHPEVGEQFEDQLFELVTSDEGIAEFNKSYQWAAKQNINPWNVHGMLEWAAHQCDQQFTFSPRASRDRIIQYLEETGPMILTGRFTGSGHIVLAVGVTEEDDIIVHDPYGDWTRGYDGYVSHDAGNVNGRWKRYSGALRVYPANHIWAVLKQSAPGGYLAHFC